MLKVSVAQTGSRMFDTPATMERVEKLCRGAAAGGAALLVLPEALLGGYPKGLTFGTTVGARSEAGREMFLRYAQAAVRCPGPETEMLAGWARELSLHIVVGVVERDGGTLYCSSLLFTPEAGLRYKHRKLMPTAMERILWGMGDGTTMQVIETQIGRIGMAICWENYMPMYRQHLYSQGVELWCAPTVDSREIWQASMRHIAYEGRCFVLSACQRLTREDWPEEMRGAGTGGAGADGAGEAGVIEGCSMIVSPRGEVLARSAPADNLIHAEIDLDDILRGKFDLDTAGHYSRPDVFELRTRA